MNDQQAKTRRGLSDPFLYDLEGKGKIDLNPLLSFVKDDNTLMLAIRKEYINIYYRGGSILRLFWDKDKDHQYNAKFDFNYAEPGKRSPEAEKIIIATEEKLDLKKIIKKTSDVQEWLNNFPALKQIMDEYLTKHEKLEREFQQLVVRENNFSRLSNMTDYFIVDIEVSYPKTRFDLLAIKWPATQEARKKDKVSLAFIEMKYGKDSLTGKAGLAEHIKKLADFIKNPANLSDIRETIKVQLTQLNELGLLKHTRTEDRDFEVTEEKPEVIMLLAGYPLQSQRLHNLLFNEEKEALNLYAQDTEFDLKFHWPHSAGYGLFIKDMIPLDCFKERLNSLMFLEKSPTP